jgi:cytochrome c biogenesis protein CcmG/thiol:disulfide interchange protein DsbE
VTAVDGDGAGPPDPSTIDVAVRRSGSARMAALVAGAVLAVLVAVLVVSDPQGEDLRREVVGGPAPSVRGSTVDGRVVDLAQWRGQWVVVNFFATWCIPCVREHPELVAFSAAHAGDPVRVVSVGFDESPEAVREFFAERGGDWPVLAEETGAIALEFGVRAVPESYLVAPDGRVVEVFVAGVTAALLDEAIAVHGGFDVADPEATPGTAGDPGPVAAGGSPSVEPGP